jgi:hypothetical protein
MALESFDITIDGRKFYTLPHDEDRVEYLVENPNRDPKDVAILMVSIFRNKGFMDMVELVEIDDAEDDFHTHVILGRLALVDWIVGFSLDKDRQRELKATERVAGVFGERFGWNPTVTVDDDPAEHQEELYFRWSVSKLDKGIPEAWSE